MKTKPIVRGQRKAKPVTRVDPYWTTPAPKKKTPAKPKKPAGHDKFSCLERTVERLAEQVTTEFEWIRSRHGLATKADLKKTEKKIMARLNEIIEAANALSTASDAQSLKQDTLIAKVDILLGMAPSDILTPEGEAALAALRSARDNSVAAGAKLDAEVLKLDAVLPTPAPPAPPEPVEPPQRAKAKAPLQDQRVPIPGSERK